MTLLGLAGLEFFEDGLEQLVGQPEIVPEELHHVEESQGPLEALGQLPGEVALDLLAVRKIRGNEDLLDGRSAFPFLGHEDGNS